MQCSRSSDLLTIDPKIESTYICLLKENKDREVVMASNEEKNALQDYAIPSLTGATSCCREQHHVDNPIRQLRIEDMIDSDGAK